MTTIDRSRQYDLEELAKAKKGAKTARERDYFDKIIHRICTQSTTVTSLRNELIEALRHNDTSRIRRIQAHIQAVRLEETRGNSWGQDKAEKKMLK